MIEWLMGSIKILYVTILCLYNLFLDGKMSFSVAYLRVSGYASHLIHILSLDTCRKVSVGCFG